MLNDHCRATKTSPRPIFPANIFPLFTADTLISPLFADYLSQLHHPHQDVVTASDCNYYHYYYGIIISMNLATPQVRILSTACDLFSNQTNITHTMVLNIRTHFS